LEKSSPIGIQVPQNVTLAFDRIFCYRQATRTYTIISPQSSRSQGRRGEGADTPDTCNSSKDRGDGRRHAREGKRARIRGFAIWRRTIIRRGRTTGGGGGTMRRTIDGPLFARRSSTPSISSVIPFARACFMRADLPGRRRFAAAALVRFHSDDDRRRCSRRRRGTQRRTNKSRRS